MSKQNGGMATTVEEVPLSPLKRIQTGSSFAGAFDAIGMSGYGEYSFPNGVVYRGYFEDGLFHGNGELVYNAGPAAGSVISGQWVKGVLTERTVFFNDTLEYDDHNWKYCKTPDRRYEVEYETDLLPAGKSHLTLDVPPRKIPPGLYDVGDGFYNPKRKVVSDYEGKLDVIRGPHRRERKWIVDNCRTEPLGPIGPRPDLYETWSAPVVEPTPLPDPIVKFKKMSKNPSLFNQNVEDGPVFYDPNLHLDLQRFEKVKILMLVILTTKMRPIHYYYLLTSHVDVENGDV